MDNEYVDKLNQSYDILLSDILLIYRKNHGYRINECVEDTEVLKEFLKCYSNLKDVAIGRKKR